MAYLRLRNEEPIAIYDRAFRLRANETQVCVPNSCCQMVPTKNFSADSPLLLLSRGTSTFFTQQVRVDDYTKVGALLGALITTTVFYKRARLINNLAGGAALGIAGGVLTHVAQLAQSGGSQAVAEEVQALPDPVELGKGVKEGK